MRKKKAILIESDDIHKTYSGFHHFMYSVSVVKITEKTLKDDGCFALGCFLDENGISNDMANTEYMGHLTICVDKDVDDELLAQKLTEFLNQ